MSTIPSPWLNCSPAARGKTCSIGSVSLGAFRFSTDPVGTFTLRLKNIVAGSRVRVETQAAGAFVDEFVAVGGDEDRLLPLYASGNANNSLRIRVRRASAAPKYKPFETYAEAQAGTVVSYVSQEPDLIA